MTRVGVGPAQRAAPGGGMALRGDRIHRYVSAFCPRCHDESPDRPLADVARLSGWLAVRDGQVWLERGCARHGLISTLYDESADILSYLEEWTAPTKAHTPDRVGNYLPVPAAYEFGLPEMQTQHTCILLEDVIEHCNLRCPTCFTVSGPQLQGVVSLAQILASVDTRLEREHGRLDVLMLSGGEPTLHPELDALLDELVSRPIVRILINSNGLRIAQDDALLAVLRRHRERVEVYLQYDGGSPEASIDPTRRLTHGGVLRRLGEQTNGQVTWRDLTALPCSHPHCCSVGYLLRDDAGEWRSLTELIGHDTLKGWLDLDPELLANRICSTCSASSPRCRIPRSAPSGVISARTATSACPPWPPWHRRRCPAAPPGCANYSVSGWCA